MRAMDRQEPLETPEGFGANVRRLRKERHYSVYVFAELAGLSVGYLCSLERGRRDVSITTIGAIAKGLGIPMRDLFGPPEGIPESVLELVRMFAAAPPEWRAAIWELLRYEPQGERKPKAEVQSPKGAGIAEVIPIGGKHATARAQAHGRQASGAEEADETEDAYMEEPVTSQAFGALIRRMRKERGFTVEGLARASGLSLGYVATIEKGDRHPSLSSLKALAHGMGMSVWALLGGRGEKYSADVMEFAKVIETADEPLRKAIVLLLSQREKETPRKTPNECG